MFFTMSEGGDREGRRGWREGVGPNGHGQEEAGVVHPSTGIEAPEMFLAPISGEVREPRSKDWRLAGDESATGYFAAEQGEDTANRLHIVHCASALVLHPRGQKHKDAVNTHGR